MNLMYSEFKDVLQHEEFDESDLYNAFLTGWGHRDEWNLPDAPHRIFREPIPDNVIREYYQLGWKRGIDKGI